MLSPYCPLSPSHADIYTLHCHAYSHLPLILIRPHAGCLHIYFCLPHPVHAIATETGLTALLVLQIHPHFYSLYNKKKNIFLYLFSPSPTETPYVHHKFIFVSLGLPDTTAHFFLSLKETCKISRAM